MIRTSISKKNVFSIFVFLNEVEGGELSLKNYYISKYLNYYQYVTLKKKVFLSKEKKNN